MVTVRPALSHNSQPNNRTVTSRPHNQKPRQEIRSIIATMRFICLLAAILIASASAFVPQNVARSDGVAMMAKKEDVENFKKPEFVASVSEKTGLSKAESEAALAAVLETIQEEVAAGKRITLLGFGTFKLSHRAARKGRNPQTGEEIQIKASNSPSFSASKAFKERCN